MGMTRDWNDVPRKRGSRRRAAVIGCILAVAVAIAIVLVLVLHPFGTPSGEDGDSEAPQASSTDQDTRKTDNTSGNGSSSSTTNVSGNGQGSTSSSSTSQVPSETYDEGEPDLDTSKQSQQGSLVTNQYTLDRDRMASLSREFATVYLDNPSNGDATARVQGAMAYVNSTYVNDNKDGLLYKDLMGGNHSLARVASLNSIDSVDIINAQANKNGDGSLAYVKVVATVTGRTGGDDGGSVTSSTSQETIKIGIDSNYTICSASFKI